MEINIVKFYRHFCILIADNRLSVTLLRYRLQLLRFTLILTQYYFKNLQNLFQTLSFKEHYAITQIIFIAFNGGVT